MGLAEWIAEWMLPAAAATTTTVARCLSTKDGGDSLCLASEGKKVVFARFLLGQGLSHEFCPIPCRAVNSRVISHTKQNYWASWGMSESTSLIGIIVQIFLSVVFGAIVLLP